MDSQFGHYCRTLSIFAGNVLGPTVFCMDFFRQAGRQAGRQTYILPGRIVRLLHVYCTLESFIESFVQKLNDSSFRQLKEPVLTDSLEPVPTQF